MLGSTWYHGMIRKYVILFGSLFDDISISRVDSNNDTVKTLKVPIQYGPKERYLAREIQNPELNRPISFTYPRMSFEITDIKYAADRKLNSNDVCRTGSISDTSTMGVQNNPVPYDISFRLSIIARNSDDALRIVEQILPFFSPMLNVSVNLIPEMNYGNVTVPVLLTSVSQDENYQGEFESPENVIWTLDFVLKGNMYGPVILGGKVIKEVYVNFYTPAGNNLAASVGLTPNSEHVYVRPGLTANGEPTANAADSVSISSISSTDDYGFIINYVRDEEP